MMHISHTLVGVTLGALLLLPGVVKAQPAVSSGTYSNPVLKRDFPDPSVIYGQDRYFYVYGTDGGGKYRISTAST